MLTDRDIVLKAIAEGKDITRTWSPSYAEGKAVTIGADDSIDEALRNHDRGRCAGCR